MLRPSKVSADQKQALIALFRLTFSASEGQEEGAVIATFVSELLDTTAEEDLFIATQYRDGTIIAAALFSRLSFSADPRSVFILSPMAVAPEFQGQGIGQSLITEALAFLRGSGVDIAITYGDPAFYQKTGFKALTSEIAQPPMPLSFPHGWIGQSLSGGSFTSLQGDCTCVPALNAPHLW